MYDEAFQTNIRMEQEDEKEKKEPKNSGTKKQRH